jgi:Cys-tRNA(Pro) deacylase
LEHLGTKIERMHLEMTLEEKIQKILSEKKIDYEVFDHEPVYTNPAMSQALSVSEAETVKTLVLATKEGGIIAVVLPGDRRVDWKAVARAAQSRKVSFAKADVVLEQVGCEVGCVPPFGHFRSLPVYLDERLAKTPFIYFNPGRHDKSYRIAGAALEALCEPVWLEEK